MNNFCADIAQLRNTVLVSSHLEPVGIFDVGHILALLLVAGPKFEPFHNASCTLL